MFNCIYLQGSTTNTPNRELDGEGKVIGDVCPKGSYCPEGSITPRACPPGTFSASSGNTNSSDCMSCTAGYYCPNASTVVPLECPTGYYCPIGSVYYELLCDEGQYCPTGSASPQVRVYVSLL